MNQYINKRFANQYKATIGADLCVPLMAPRLPPQLTVVAQLD
jgi:hypothetical protein